MEEQKIANGGLQTVVQIAVPQIIYLDFDGELTKYDGTVLKIDRVEVADPLLSAERIAGITGELNQKFAAQNVIFVTEKPASADFSTIFIGKSDDFSAYGTFQGMAETVDLNNTKPTDNAFVLLDKTSTDQEIIATIAHEAGHLLGTLNHGGEGLQAYAAITSVTSGQTVSGITVASGDSLCISSGGSVTDATISYGGSMYISSGGVANDVTVSSGYMNVFSGGTADNITVNYGGSATIYSGGTASIAFNPWSGTIVSSAGAVVNYLERDAEVYFGGSAQGIISQGAALSDIYIGSNLSAIVYESGSLINASLQSGGRVMNYGTVENLVVNSGGVVNNYGTLSVVWNPWGDNSKIYGNGSVTYLERDAEIYYGNTVSGLLDRGGSTENLTLSGGLSAIVYEDGVVSGADVQVGGNLLLAVGGSALKVRENGGFVSAAEGAEIEFIEHTFSNTELNSGNSATVHSRTSAVDITVNTNAQMDVFDGGNLSQLKVNGGHVNIFDGGRLDNYSVTGGWIHISGGSATNGSVTSGYVNVYNSAALENITVTGKGRITIQSGAYISNLKADATAYLGITVADNTYVEGSYGGSSFVMKDAVLNSFDLRSGFIAVSSGGTVNDITVSSGGYIVMNNGADGGQITVQSGGIVYISSGADASGITLHSGGRMYVFAGGNVENITLNAGGSVYVSSGGKAEICFNPWRGAVFASAGAAVTYLQRDNNVYYGNYSQGIVSQGNSLSALDIASGNSVIVYSNGNLADATVHAGGMMYVSSGGTASEIVEYGGYVNIADGAQVTFAEHTIDKMNLSSGHRATFHSGTTVEKLLVNSGAAAYIYNGGSAVDLHVSSGGTTWIYDHGIAQSVTVHAGGNITIYSGAVVSSLDWTPCEGRVFVEDGATVNFTRELTGVYLGSNNHLIAHEMVISNSSMGSGALMYVMQNGSAVNISAFKEGHIHVSSGGLIDSATLNNFGRLFVYNGGIAENTVLNTNGLLILSGGYAENTVVNGGGMHLSSGSADKVTVHANGYLYLSSGTTATNLDIAQNAGFLVTVAKDTYAQWSSGGKSFETGNGYLADYTVGSRAHLSLMDGRMENITVENGGYIYLYHGTAENITVASRGNVTARDQAVLNSAVILEQGRLSVIGSATVNDLTLNGSAAFLQQAHINGAVIGSTGYLTIADSVLAEDISIQRGKLLVHSGATAENVLLNRFGSLSVESGGSVTLAYNPWKGYISTASGAEVTYLDACGVYVGNFESGLVSSYSGPQIKDIVITGPAYGMNFSAVVINASIEKALLAARAYMFVSSGGAAYDTTINMGGMIVFSGGIASGGSVISGGVILVLNGGQAETLNIANGRIMASSGAQISNITTLRGGYINVLSSAAAYDLAVSSGGILNISGGNVTNVDLHAYGSATLSSGELAGVVKVAKDAVLTVANGSIRNHSTLYLQGRLVLNQKQLRNKYNLVIDLQGALPAANDNCYVTNSVNLSDSVNIIVKVDADQAFGNYVLTDSAAVITVTAQDLTGSIAPGSKVDTLGTLSLNNTSFTAGNVKYQLLQKNGKYVLSINEAKIISAPQIAADKVEITNGDVTLSATFDAYSVKNEFSLDGTLYQLYQNPIKLSENATVYFRSTDEDDNVVETSYTVSNIDKVAPDAPVITASLDNDTPTTGTVELYAEFAADSVLNEYSFDNVNFFSYRNHITVKENSTVYFRSKDAAGNYSVGSYAVSNITDQAPDLLVSDFYLTDYSDEKTATFQIYDDITLHFTVNNQGNTASEATVATILVDGEAYDCIDIDAIAANGSTELFYTVTSDEDWALGTHNIGIVIDAENTLLELDDGNNQTATTILLEDEYLPDLVISNIALESTETALGDTGKLLVTVRNNSFGTADISKLQIKIGNQVLDELEVGELDYYQRESFTIDIPTDGYQMGKYRIEVTADSADDLEEVSEVNNRAAIFWEVKAPDLQIVSFATREDFFLDDQPITLEVIVRNNGNIASKATTAKIVSNDQELYVADLHELKAGESTRIEAVLAPGALAAGSHTLSLQLDNDNKAAESDENNNSQDLQLLVVLHDETKPEIIEFDLVQQKASYKFNLSTKVSDNISTSDEITTELQYAFDRSQLEQSDFTASAPPNFTAADAGKELYFRIAVRDAAGNQSISQIRSVKIADVTAPEIPEAAYSLAAQKITINYSASDNCAVTAYKIYLDDALVATTADGSWTSSVLSVGEHTFRIEALDKAGNSTSCETHRFEIGDTIAPTVTDISIKQSGNSYKFNVTLNAQDNNTAAEELKYFVKYASGAAELESAAWIDGLAFELDAAATGKSYFYSAGVMDLAGNISWSNAQQFTVLDTTAPDKISQINSVVSDDSVKISWTEVQDNTGILEYEIRCKQADGEFEYITVTGNNFDLQDLSAGEYTFNIRAYDLSGNASEWSDDCTFSIFERDPYELGNDFDTAFDLGLLKGNGSLDNSAVISNAQDIDCYKFTLSDNGNSNDWFRASAQGSDKGHLQFSLYTANGVLLEDYTQDPGGKFSLDGLFAGSYYLMVKGLNGAGGKYDLQWKCSTKVEKDAWENNNSITEASVLDLAKETDGTIYLTIDSRNDEDFFKIILPHFGSVQDYFTISFNNEISDLDLTLLDSEGDWVAESAGLGSEETISLEGLAAGTYYLRVNGSKANEYTLNYQISDGNPLPDELEGSSDPIALSGRTTYRDLSICAGDDSSDIFSFELDHVGSKNDRISFRPQNMEWNSGMKYELLDESGAVAAFGTGYEVKLTDLMAGNYTLVLDTPIEGSGSKYNIKSHIRQGNEEENQSWAVFIYIDGDDQVLDGYFFKDLQKMYAAELNDNVDVYIMYDRYDMSVTDAMTHDIWENTRVGKLTNGRISWSQLGGKDEWDMSSRNTLEQFIQWGLNDSTAQNCALVIKDHGSPLGYCCSDADTGYYLNDNEKASPMLTAREIGELVGSYEQFKVTVFDACWMGSDVVINAMEGKCDYVVASEAVAWTPDISIRYKDFLESITGNMTAEEFASAAVDANGNKQQFVTMAAFYTAEKNFTNALNAFAEAAEKFTVSDWIRVANAFAAAPNYAEGHSAFSDILHIASSIKNGSEQMLSATADLIDAIKSSIVAFNAYPKSYGNGLAVLNPLQSDLDQLKDSYIGAYEGNKWNYFESDLGKGAWGEFLKKLHLYRGSHEIIKVSTAVLPGKTNIKDTAKMSVFTSYDIGVFSGEGVKLEQLAVNDTICFSLDITRDGTAGDIIRAISENANADLSMTLYDSSMNELLSGSDSISLENIDIAANGTNYYLQVSTSEASSLTLSMHGNWTSGVDRYDYRISQSNEAGANGNGTFAKATQLTTGFYGGLVTSQDDEDIYSIGNQYFNRYTVTITAAEGLTVEEYSADGSQNLVQEAAYQNGKYILEVAAGSYLKVCGKGDLSKNEVNSYSIKVELLEGASRVSPAPAAPEVSADIMHLTSGVVTLTAKFSAESAICQYRIDNGKWLTYKAPVKVSENAVVSFRAASSQNVYCNPVEYAVTNIDNVAPDKPVASADITEATNHSVTVKAEFSSDSVVCEYSLDNISWKTYPEAGISFKQNGKVYFRSFDQAGNASEVTVYEVNNIDKVAPELPTVQADVTDITDLAVYVSATFSNDSTVREYSLNGVDYMAYTGAVKVEENTTLYFRAADAVGNYTQAVTYEVKNIAPVDKYNMTSKSYGYGGNFDGSIAHETNLTVSGGTFKRFFGGNNINQTRTFVDVTGEINLFIHGGTFSSVVAGGDYVAGGIVERQGDINFTIRGGVFNQNVGGGLCFQSADTSNISMAVANNINFTIAGGTFNKRICAGNFSGKSNYSNYAEVKGNINLTVDATNSDITINEYLVAGSSGYGWVRGNITVTLKKSAEHKFNFSNTISGGSEYAYYTNYADGRRSATSYVDGSRTVVLDGYVGEFDGKLLMFEKVKVTASTDIEFTNKDFDFSDISSWEIEAGASLNNIARNNFKGDTLYFDLSDWDAESPWQVMSGTDNTFKGLTEATIKFDNTTVAYDSTLNAWCSSEYKLAIEEDDNGTKRMIVSAIEA